MVNLRVMPPPPRNRRWELEIDLPNDQAILWLRTIWWGEGKGLAFVHEVGKASYNYMKVSTASIDDLVEGVIVAAEEILADTGETARRKGKVDEKAQELSKRLGIKVKVK